MTNCENIETIQIGFVCKNSEYLLSNMLDPEFGASSFGNLHYFLKIPLEKLTEVVTQYGGRIKKTKIYSFDNYEIFFHDKRYEEFVDEYLLPQTMAIILVDGLPKIDKDIIQIKVRRLLE